MINNSLKIFFTAITVTLGILPHAYSASLNIDLTQEIQDVIQTKMEKSFSPVMPLNAIADQFTDVPKIDPSSFNFDKYFRPGDEPAIKAATQLFLQNISESIRNFIELKLVLHQLEQRLQETDNLNSENKLSNAALVADFSDFKSYSKKAMYAILKFDRPLVDVLVLCKSEICVQTLYHTSQAMVKFSKKMSERENEIFCRNDPFLKFLLNQAQTLAKAQAPQFELNYQAFRKINGEFISYWNQEKSSSKVWYSILGGKEHLNIVDLKFGKVHGSEFKTKSKWIENISIQRTQDLQKAPELWLNPENYPAPIKYLRKISFRCDPFPAQGSFSASLAAGGRRPMLCIDPDGNVYDVVAYSFGGSAHIGFDFINGFIIRSPKYIRPTGIWVGPSATIGAGGQADGALLFGKKGSVAILGGAGIGLGAGVSLLGIKIKPHQK